MTCVVGLVYCGLVYMGGDSAAVGGLQLTVSSQPKVFRNGDFLIGYTSSFRMGQLLQHSLTCPAPYPGTDIHRFMVVDFVDALRACFKDGGYARKDSERESAGQFLVGFQGRLFFIDNDYHVGESADGYDAVGCGAQIALGSLFSTKEFDPNGRVLLALHAAQNHSAGVRAPFHTEVLEAPQ